MERESECVCIPTFTDIKYFNGIPSNFFCLVCMPIVHEKVFGMAIKMQPIV